MVSVRVSQTTGFELEPLPKRLPPEFLMDKYSINSARSSMRCTCAGRHLSRSTSTLLTPRQTECQLVVSTLRVVLSRSGVGRIKLEDIAHWTGL